MKHILIVDDDIHIGDMLEEVLKKEGYETSRAYSGTEVLLVLDKRSPDLILLDLMLPGLSGEELLPKLRDIPVIVVSAKIDVEDKVGMLLGGATDYVTKPFEIKELLARIVAALRRSGETDGTKDHKRNRQYKEQEYICGDLKLNIVSHQVSAADDPVHLTRTEYAILKLLMRNPDQVIPKTLLLEEISADTPDCTENSLKMHISNLRKKLREADGRDHIEAVWGIGFKMRS